MHSLLQDIEGLLAASRDVIGAEEMDAAQLQTWSAERDMIFARLKIHDLARAAAASPALEARILELLEVDGKICDRLIESQMRVGEQITAARKFRRALSPAASNSRPLLRRFA